MFVNAFHRPRLLCGLGVVRGNYRRGEQRMHQNGEGRKTKGGEKTFLRPFLKRKEVRVGLKLRYPRSFVVPITSCSARVRMVWPRPSAAMSIRKKIAFIKSSYVLLLSCIHLLFPAHMPFYSTQSLRLVVQHWTPKTVHTVSNVHQNIAIKGLLIFMSLKMHENAYNRIWFFKNFPGEHAPGPP